jgi:hypothetical protein
MFAFKARRATGYGAPLKPSAYPFSNSYPTAPNSGRILNLGANQTGDPRASSSHGAATWEFNGGRQSTFYPNTGGIPAGVIPSPGDNTAGLSASNLVVFGAVAIALLILFRK